jgi:ribosomal-protein-alanine N-acetyltransferase
MLKVTMNSPIDDFPTLLTPRLVLRAIQESDLPAVQRNFSDYETVRTLAAHIPWPYPEDGTEVWYREKVVPNQGTNQWTWAICLKESPSELIGVIDLFRKGRPSHRGFWLDRQHWGKGYMTEATTAVTDYAFNQLGFDALIFDNAVGNTASARIKESAGAELIEVVPQKFVDPALTHSQRWKLTKEAWQSQRNRSSFNPLLRD